MASQNEEVASVVMMDHLWSADQHKCRASVPETIFVRNARPQKWIFTTRNNEIAKKRSVDLNLILTRFGRATNFDEKECLAYTNTGAVHRVDIAEVAESDFLQDIVALQGIVPSGSVYQNHYHVDKNKPVYHTTTYTLDWKFNTVTNKTERMLRSAVRCRAAEILDKLNHMTLTVVRHLEQQTSSRIVDFTAEYILDSSDRPFLTWIISAVKAPSSSEKRKRPVRRRSNVEASSPRSPMEVEAMGILVSHATHNIEHPRTPSNTANRRNNRNASFAVVNPVVELTNANLVDDDNLLETIGDAKTKRDGHFPNPFNCHGDFCDFVVQDPNELSKVMADGSPPKTDSLAIARRLLSKEEMTELSRKLGIDAESNLEEKNEVFRTNDFTSLSSHYAKAKRDHYTLPMKSIAIARKEKRGYLERLGISGGAQAKLKNYQRNKRDGFTGLDAAEQLKAEHGGVPLGLYYQQVSLCESCYIVYTTLDRARDIMQQEAQNGRIAARRERNPDHSGEAREELIARLCTKKGRPRSRGQHRTRTPSPIRSARKYMEEEVPVILPSKSMKELSVEERVALEEKVKQQKLESSTNNVATAIVKASDGAKCTREENRRLKEMHSNMKTYDDYDSYLRGTRPKHKTKTKSSTEIRTEDESKLNREKRVKPSKRSKLKKQKAGYQGHVLLVEEDLDIRATVTRILEEKEYVITQFDDSPQALDLCREHHFDLLIVATELSTFSGVEMAKIIRKREKKEDHDLRRLPIVAFTHQTEPEDLRLYMEVGMDGCISKPLDKTSLLNTVHAAIPHHRPSVEATDKPSNNSKKVPPMRPSTTGLVTSSDVAKLSLPVPSPHARLANNDSAEITSVGMFQMDADTAFPYMVLGSRIPDSVLFNFVVIHDFFDTYETVQIFFKPILSKYPGMQVLLFNLPGQAFTEWRKDTVLNNEYYSECTEALVRHVDYNGTKEFETRGPYATPFYLLGFGNGANIATHYALRFKPPAMRAILSLNGFTHVDPHLAGVLHDCMNVFSCSPATRPDLPIYFYTRFLFSSAYLSKVSTPLALNLYTAVHNPITLDGRMQICKGALAHVDLRPMLSAFHQPIILVQASQGGLVKPLHVEPFVKLRGGEVRSVRQCLKERRRPCVIWLRSGHELFQECRRPLSDLIEQLATGYHEKHDVTFLPTSQEISHVTTTKNKKKKKQQPDGQHFEDRFIDNVLGTLQQVRDESRAEPNPFLPPSSDGNVPQQHSHVQDDAEDKFARLNESCDPNENPRAEIARWSLHQSETGQAAKQKSKSRTKKEKKFNKLKLSSPTEEDAPLTLDPTKRNFEFGQKKNKNNDSDSDEDEYYSKKGKMLQPVDVPEVREYMQWRIARNRKRLSKLVQASSCIQRGWRAYLAKTMVKNLRRKRAALFIQTRWRAKLARERLAERKKEEWAVRLVQRCWRGKAGRDSFLDRKIKEAAARQMQRIFRGKRGKDRVKGLKLRRRRAAMKIQNLVRAHIARNFCWKVREQRNASIDIQRTFRGFRGRVRAALERDKYLFSKAQSQGIDFGRQMLLEHKLHGTRLQSEVSILTKEKVETEEKVEALLSEIAEFDKGVRGLEREMHELTAVETEAKGVLDEEAKVELREQKMRLDREFGVMLGKIADRKERLKTLEVKLQTIDRSRQGKEEELRDLERKLVVLLEEQQQELEQIKKRQDTRGELMLPENAATLIASKHGTPGSGSPGAFGGGYQGPTPQQQQQANNMMQSTESLMKFGFMSMSLTYFSSINMIRAMRKVGALNTVLNGPAGTAQGQEQIQALLSNGGVPSGLPEESSSIMMSDAMSFKPAHKPGQMPPESNEKLAVAAWTVGDVGDWLETLKLKQYTTSFADAAIDGAFLYDLNDDDLRNTLGIEHNLHRKKILNSITRLRRVEEAREASGLSNSSLSQNSLMSIAAAGGGVGGGSGTGITPAITSSGVTPAAVSSSSPAAIVGVDVGESGAGSASGGVTATPSQLMSMVRHGKMKELRPALEALPDIKFDPNDVTTPFIEGFGTQYRDELNRLVWHINKADDHGNTLMSIAAQNGKLKVAQFLFQKGANPDHQNNQGQSALHYAMAYNFYDLGAWLADADSGAGASDQVTNMYELTCYDGLTPE